MKFKLDYWYEVSKGNVTWLKKSCEDPSDPKYMLTFDSWDELMNWARIDEGSNVEVELDASNEIMEAWIIFKNNLWWRLGFYYHR